MSAHDAHVAEISRILEALAAVRRSIVEAQLQEKTPTVGLHALMLAHAGLISARADLREVREAHAQGQPAYSCVVSLDGMVIYTATFTGPGMTHLQAKALALIEIRERELLYDRLDLVQATDQLEIEAFGELEKLQRQEEQDPTKLKHPVIILGAMTHA